MFLHFDFTSMLNSAAILELFARRRFFFIFFIKMSTKIDKKYMFALVIESLQLLENFAQISTILNSAAILIFRII
jgi:hypothetical protein